MRGKGDSTTDPKIGKAMKTRGEMSSPGQKER